MRSEYQEDSNHNYIITNVVWRSKSVDSVICFQIQNFYSCDIWRLTVHTTQSMLFI